MPNSSSQSVVEKRGIRLLGLAEKVPRFRSARQAKALIDAMRYGDEGLALWLVKHGVDPRAADHKGRSALWWAAALSQPSVIRELVKRGTPLPDGVLMGPVTAGDIKTVRLLIRRGANVNCVASEYSPVGHFNIKRVLLTAALGEAAAEPRAEAIPIMLVRAGAKVSRLISPTALLPEAWNFSMLGKAAYSGLLRTARAMIAAGANVNLRDNRGRTALFDALEQRHFAVAKELLRAGARTDIRDSAGLTPLEALRQQEQPLQMLVTEQRILGGAKVDEAEVQAQADAWHRLRARMIAFVERHMRNNKEQ